MNLVIEEDPDDIFDLDLPKKEKGNIFDADIYFHAKYNGLEGKAVSDNIRQLNTSTPSKPRLMGLNVDPNTYTSTILSQAVYIPLLTLYENNQMVLMDTLNNSESKSEKEKDEIKAKLLNLELWFIQVIEPRPTRLDEIGEWTEREKLKLKCQSGYCDEDAHVVIRKYSKKKMDLVTPVMRQVRDNYDFLVKNKLIF